MKLFKCSRCGQLLYFENRRCEQCGYPLGFISQSLELVPLELQEDKHFKIFNGNQEGSYTYCLNAVYGVCNWLVHANSKTGYCAACELNHMIPNLSKQEYIKRWKVLEESKHRLVYALLRMKLPLVSKAKDPKQGLFFDFLADEKKDGGTRVLTGHDEGLITISIAEADDIERLMKR